MTEIHSNTEDKILEAAKKVFIEKGLEGTRMQEIADEARINKALLHYYYRTKEKLFAAVFRFALSKFIPRIEEILNAEMPLFEKIELIVNQYITLLKKNPIIPIFVLHEINRHPDRLLEAMTGSGVNPEIFIKQIEKEVSAGNIKPIDSRQLIVNILSLCVFPFAAKPLIKGLFFNNNKNLYDEFIESRKKEVSGFIIDAIKK